MIFNRNRTVCVPVGLLLATLILFTLPLPVIAAGSGDYYYHDKLFDKLFSFTPKQDEIMIRFDTGGAGAQITGIRELVSRNKLESVRDLVEKRGFGIYGIPGGSAVEELLSRLEKDPLVRAAHQVLVDQEGSTRYFIPDEITVRFEKEIPEPDMLAIISAHGCTVAGDHWTPGYYTLRLPAGGDAFAAIREFMELAEVRFAELSSVGFMELFFDADDTHYGQQWALYNNGSTGGTADADIDAREAWNIETGDPDVLIAVLDTGVDWRHEDLRGNLWQNPGEDSDGDGVTIEWNGSSWELDPGDLDGLDNDGNGSVDDLVGWDFYENDNDPDDLYGHGTCCAGIAGAVSDNSMGIAGVAHDCRIMPLTGDFWVGDVTSFSDAINYAASFIGDYDGIVISNSWGSSTDFTAIHDAITDAKNDGVVLCFASGNGDDTPISYPARYAEVIAVGATNEDDDRCDVDDWGTDWYGNDQGSDYGDSLDIAAPGVNLYATDITGADAYSSDDYYDSFGGTSGATPHVAGAAALIISLHYRINAAGTSLTPDDVQDILKDNADQVGGYDYNHDGSRPGHSIELGYGRLNVNQALQEVIARAVLDLQPDPVDLCLSIDRSGSMAGDKISAAKNAASQVVRLMNTGDRIGVTSYSSTSSVDYYLSEITSETIKDDAITAVNGLSTGGNTSIGGGLRTAQGELFWANPSYDPQAIILMSDGKSNTAPWVEETLAELPSSTDVYTIGFASSTTDINEDTLQTIADDTGGEYYFAGADGLALGPGGSKGSGGLELITGYQLSLNESAQRVMLDLITVDAGDSFFDVFCSDIDPSIHEIRFNLLWEDSTTTTTFTLKEPGGRIIDPSVAAGDPMIEYLQDKTLASYAVISPVPGKWELEVSGQGYGDTFYLSISGYTLLTSDLAIKNEGLFLPLTIENKLLENGLPVTGAVVFAEVITPREQIATLQLFDDGFHRDGEADDGLYANFDMGIVSVDGSYTVKCSVSGFSSQTLAKFQRYDSGSFYVAEQGVAVEAALPHTRALPGALVKVPVYINNDTFGRDIDRYIFNMRYMPNVLKATGDYEVAGTMSSGWTVNLSMPHDNRVIVDAAGPILKDRGILINLLFEITGKPGQASPLVFDHIEMNGGSVNVNAAAGEMIVGSTFLFEEPVTATITPADSVIVIPPEGGAFAYNVSFRNNTDDIQIFDTWTLVHTPGGDEFGPILGPRELHLFPLSSAGRDFNLFVPSYAFPGDYEYTLYVGTYPDVATSSDTLVFTKSPSE